jgi:hypothetical protein
MSAPSPSLDSIIVSLVEIKGTSSAIIATGAAMGIMGLSFVPALQFGAVTALGVSFGDTILTIGGIGSKVEAYMTGEPFKTYLDPNDFLGGAVGAAPINYIMGMRGRNLGIAVVVAAVAAGVAPKLSAYIASTLQPTPPPPNASR